MIQAQCLWCNPNNALAGHCTLWMNPTTTKKTAECDANEGGNITHSKSARQRNRGKQGARQT